MKRHAHLPPAGPRFRLAAIDLDGTLLGPDLTISAQNLRALATLQRSGVEVVLASGRHYLSMRPYVEQVPAVRWVVSAQGAEVSDRTRGVVLQRSFLPPAHVEAVLAATERERVTAVVYTPDGIFTTSARNSHLEFYRRLSGCRPTRTARDQVLDHAVFKVVWLGTAQRMTRAMRETEPPAGTEKVQTHARIVEFMPCGVTKASGLTVLAAELRIRREEAVVFGDGENDIPMFAWAGTSMAMPHGWPAALASATHVAPSGPAETALARAVELALNLP